MTEAQRKKLHDWVCDCWFYLDQVQYTEFLTTCDCDDCVRRGKFKLLRDHWKARRELRAFRKKYKNKIWRYHLLIDNPHIDKTQKDWLSVYKKRKTEK